MQRRTFLGCLLAAMVPGSIAGLFRKRRRTKLVLDQSIDGGTIVGADVYGKPGSNITVRHVHFKDSEVYVEPGGIIGLIRCLVVVLSMFSVAADYPIVAVRAPRAGDTTIVNWPEVVHPINVEPGTHLVLIKPDGTEEVLVSAGEAGAVLDPCPSLDGKWVYYSLVSDAKVTSGNYAFGARVPLSGADIWRVNVETKVTQKVTNQDWSPNTTRFPYSRSPIKSDPAGTAYAGVGVFNTGACPVPGGRIVFTSSRNWLMAPKGGWAWPNFQLFVMDDDGSNVEFIGHLNIGMALHPVLMKNGMVAFSSWESQGYRDPRTWALWAIHPDGSNWEPLFSGFAWSFAPHFHAVKTDGEVATTLYYNQNNNGFGTMLGFHMFPTGGTIPTPRFGSPDPAHPSNPTISLAYAGSPAWPFKFSFSPSRLRALTPSSNHLDVPASIDPAFPNDDAKRFGKYTHPSGAPDNALLASYSPGPATDNVRPIVPAYQGQVVLLPGGKVAKPSEHVVVKADTKYNYQQPKAVLPWSGVYAADPVKLPFQVNDGTKHHLLPEGTPLGLVGTSSLYKRDSANLMERQPNGTFVDSGWVKQGSDSGTYSNSEIHSIRLVETSAQANLTLLRDGAGVGATKGWTNPINERLRIIGEIAVRKPGVVDPDGNPDTSFLARIPANVPFTFQTLDKDGNVLNMAQTWHQLIPAEVRHNCGGCHAHSQVGTDFSLTAAAKPDYPIQTFLTARDVEFDRDVWPIIEAKCAECHTALHPTLDMSTPAKAYSNLVPAASASHIPKGRVVAMRPRESPLMWKIWGRKIDGSGGAIEGGQMPLGRDPLPDSEKRVLTDWIALAASRGPGVFIDDQRPTLTIARPARDESATTIVIGAVDHYSGLDETSFRVTLDGAVLTGWTKVDHVWSKTLQAPFPKGTIVAEVKDKAGNLTKVGRRFDGAAVPPPDCEAELLAAKAELAKERAKVAGLMVVSEQQAARIKSLEDAVKLIESTAESALKQ